jgi:PAS domain S-box-containing protein
MTGLMKVSMIAAVALAVVAAALAVIAWRQRKALLRLREADSPAAAASQAGDAARAMIAALREPALLYGDRIEAVNEPFAALVGVPAARLAGMTLAEVVSAEYADLAALAVQRALKGDAKPALTEVEIADSHGQVTRLELSGSVIESSGSRLVLFTAEEMLPHRADGDTGAAPARSQLALDSLGEGILTTDAHGVIDYLNQSAEALTGMRREDAVGQAFGAMIGFVDEHDRRAIADPVQQCLSASTSAVARSCSRARRAASSAWRRRPRRSAALRATSRASP